MKWFNNRCRHREEVSLLAGGALRADEKNEVERHLAACSECRTYYGELKKLTESLAEWEKEFTAIEATPAAQIRWAKAVQQTRQPSTPHQPLLKNVWRIVWRELIWPSRHAWTGMAVLWAIILFINARISDSRTFGVNIQAAAKPDLMEAWQEQNRVMAELTQPSFTVPVAPAVISRPRSELDLRWKII